MTIVQNVADIMITLIMIIISVQNVDGMKKIKNGKPQRVSSDKQTVERL
jgi:hypothetical protein